jgi:O-antigen/teichoic acid export membrane protein
VTISETVALLFLGFVFLRTNGKLKPDGKSEPAKAAVGAKRKNITIEILRQAIPVTLMAAVFPLILVFDSMFVVNILQSGGASNESATQLFGISSGAVHTLINLPAVLGMAIATAAVPTVSSLMKQNKIEELRAKMYLAIKLVFLISIFFTTVYLFFSRDILDLLYHRAFVRTPENLRLAGRLMNIESILIFGMGLSALFTALLQGIDRARFPLAALILGGTAKIIFELIFLKTSMGIYAVSIGNVICFAIVCAINAFFVLKFIKIKKGVSRGVLKFLGLAAAFALAVRFLTIVLPAGRWWVLAGGTASFGIYVILLALFGFLRFNCFTPGNNPDVSKGDFKK